MAEARGKPLSDLMLEFIGALRGAGVRVSVAETLDAMRAVSAAGLTRSRMREALRASLIKDEAHSPIFDELFAGYFEAPRGISGAPRSSRDRSIGVTGKGGGQSQTTTPTASRDRPEPSPSAEPHPDASAEPGAPTAYPDGRAQHDGSRDSATARKSGEQSRTAAASSGVRDGEAPRQTGIRDIERVPFARYSTLEYEQAREALAILQRRLRVRLGRRMRLARRGRLDFRRTIRAAIQRGGALLDLRFRTRRPRHIDLVVLADISGSVHYASTLMLELIAGAQRCFRRMRAFVFIDRLAAADFEAGHLVMTPVLDLYARSDFGRVFAELRDQHADLLTRATVLVIMGDGRNNRRPARADILRDLARRSRAAIWLNPEPPERWGTGDSAIESYRKVVDVLLPSGNLRELEAALAQIN
jgi:uncharacterized protein with von Willebrand factor type A (vWA) domain